MRVSTTSGVIRIMGIWVRRADAGLARTAARNAAASMADLHTRRVEEARTLWELQSLFPLSSEIPPPSKLPDPEPAAGSATRTG